jgi:hypothetical protein
VTRFDLVTHIDFGGRIIPDTNNGKRGRPVFGSQRGDARPKLFLNFPANSLPIEDRPAHAPVRITKGSDNGGVRSCLQIRPGVDPPRDHLAKKAGPPRPIRDIPESPI